MHDRFSFRALLLVAFALPIAGCTNSAQVDAIVVTPTGSALNVGQTVQLTATGTYTHAAPHPATYQDVTASATWTSSAPSVATVSTTGLVTAVTAGTATISASMNGFTGLVSGNVTVTVTNPSGTSGTSGSVTGLQSLTILPSAISIENLQGTGEFLAIATYTDGTVKDVTNSVTWISDAPNTFPISTNGTGVASSGTTAGIVTAYGSTSTVGDVIIAELTDPTTGSIVTATASFACPYIAPTYSTSPQGVVTLVALGSCNEDTIGTELLSTLTVYDAGLNTTGWLVTAASATGTPDVIHCGPGSQVQGLGAPVCTATYPFRTVTASGTPGVLIEAQQIAVTGQKLGQFGGWSYNCQPSDSQGHLLTAGPYYTAAGPNYCVAPLTVTVTDDTPTNPVSFTSYPNVTIGAIFN
jgi:hypothetical protein